MRAALGPLSCEFSPAYGTRVRARAARQNKAGNLSFLHVAFSVFFPFGIIWFRIPSSHHTQVRKALYFASGSQMLTRRKSSISTKVG